MSPIHLSCLIAIHLSPLLAIHLSPLLAIHLSPIVAGGVRLSGCLQIHVSSLWRQFICLPVWLVLSGCPFVSPYSNSFVSQSGWWCPALRMSAIDLSPIIAIHLSPSLAGGVRLSGCRLPVAAKDVVPQLLPRFLHLLSPRCGLPVVSQMWFPRCCLTVRWF